MPLQKLSIIIVNYKTPDLTLRCLTSVYKNSICDIETIVVDNFSEDNSAEIIKKTFPQITIIENQSNEGFGRANNTGIAHANGKYILLLNSDIVVEENTIDKCLQYIENEPNTGVLGCKLVNSDGTLQKSVYYNTSGFVEIFRNNFLLNKLYKFKDIDMQAVMGSFMLFEKTTFIEAGGFDPDFFMYCEEVELCRRILKTGKKIIYFTEVCAMHLHQGSSANPIKSMQQNYLSNMLYIWKYKTIFGYYFYLFLKIINTIFNFICMFFLKNNAKAYRKGFYLENKAFYSIFIRFLKIPFQFSKKSFKINKICKI